jgi:hypothetical protein
VLGTLTLPHTPVYISVITNILTSLESVDVCLHTSDVFAVIQIYI